MRRIVEELYREQPSSTLIHYTSLEVLIEIAKERKLFASEIKYLNDASESYILNDLIRNLIKRKPTPRDPIEEQLLEWLDIRRNSKPLVFVACFSEKQDDLYQWRSYCPPNKGVCFGVNARRLTEKCSEQNFKIGRCIYDRQKHQSLAEKLLEAFLRVAASEQNSDSSAAPPNQKFFASFYKIEPEFLQVSCLVKHNAFEHETEWRIVSDPHSNYVAPEIKYRAGKSYLIPYLEFSLPENARGIEFEFADVGPTPNLRLAQASLQMFLSKYTDCNKTGETRIPYRDY